MQKSKRHISLKFILYITIIYLFLLPKPTHAYLDPGSGSYLFQILIAGILGSSFFVKKAYKKVKEFFDHHSREKSN